MLSKSLRLMNRNFSWNNQIAYRALNVTANLTVTGQMPEWLTEWPAEWPAEWLTEWQTEWSLNGCRNDCEWFAYPFKRRLSRIWISKIKFYLHHTGDAFHYDEFHSYHWSLGIFYFQLLTRIPPIKSGLRGVSAFKVAMASTALKKWVRKNDKRVV